MEDVQKKASYRNKVASVRDPAHEILKIVEERSYEEEKG